MAWALKPETKDHVDVSLALGKIVDVTRAPSLFININGRKFGNISQVPADTRKGLVAFPAKQGK
jgi:hypothetical protein